MIPSIFYEKKVDKYRMEKFMPTIQQHNAYEGVLKDENNDISFVAPTSFGKSELIVRHIKKVNTPSLKAAIIVPTKSLLMQTYKYVKEQLTDKRIILHDQMYTGEQSYIAVLTKTILFTAILVFTLTMSYWMIFTSIKSISIFMYDFF